jgi:hypothetical protein
MKFNSLIRIFLLVNIAFSLVSVNSNYTKKRAKISTNRRVHSKTKTKGIATILTNLQNAFSQPGNILNFVLGVLGEFIPAIDSIKGAISPAVLQATGECNSLFQIGTDQKTINGFAEMENKLANVQDKQKFCQDTKKNIEMAYLYSQAGEEPSLVGFLKLPGAIFSSAFSSAEDICNSIYTNTNKRNKANEILQLYSTKEEFLKECNFFRKISCSEFDPEISGIAAFAKQCTAYYNAVNKFANCLKAKIPVGDRLAEIFSAENLLKTLIMNGASVIANIMSFGVWGGLNGAYHLIKLGIMIKNYLDTPNKDPAYRIGAIVGRAMKIILSVVGIPTVKRLKKMKKMRRN